MENYMGQETKIRGLSPAEEMAAEMDWVSTILERIQATMYSVKSIGIRAYDVSPETRRYRIHAELSVSDVFDDDPDRVENADTVLKYTISAATPKRALAYFFAAVGQTRGNIQTIIQHRPMGI